MKVIRHSSTEADDFHAVFNALHHASVRSECGYCRYDRNQELRQSQHRRFAESVSPTPEFVTPVRLVGPNTLQNVEKEGFPFSKTTS